MWQSWNIWDNVRTKVESLLDFRNLLFYIFSKLYCSLTVFSNPQECEETVNDGWMSVRLNVFIKGLWWIWKVDRWTQQLQSHVGRLLILSSVELTRPRNVSSSVVMTDRQTQTAAPPFSPVPTWYWLFQKTQPRSETNVTVSPCNVCFLFEGTRVKTRIVFYL